MSTHANSDLWMLTFGMHDCFPDYRWTEFKRDHIDALAHEIVLVNTRTAHRRVVLNTEVAQAIMHMDEEMRRLRSHRPTKLPRLIVVAVLEWLLTQDPTSMEAMRTSMNWDEGFNYEWDDEVEALSLKVSKHFDATWKRWAEEAEEDS